MSRTHICSHKHAYTPPKSWSQAVSESQTQMERNGGRCEIRVRDGWVLEGDLNASRPQRDASRYHIVSMNNLAHVP